MTNEEGDRTKVESPPDLTLGAHTRPRSDQRAGSPSVQRVFTSERRVWVSTTLPEAAAPAAEALGANRTVQDGVVTRKAALTAAGAHRNLKYRIPSLTYN